MLSVCPKPYSRAAAKCADYRNNLKFGNNGITRSPWLGFDFDGNVASLLRVLRIIQSTPKPLAKCMFLRFMIMGLSAYFLEVTRQDLKGSCQEINIQLPWLVLWLVEVVSEIRFKF